MLKLKKKERKGEKERTGNPRKVKNQDGRKEEEISETEQIKECSRRDVPKIKMHLRGNLIWVTILVSRGLS